MFQRGTPSLRLCILLLPSVLWISVSKAAKATSSLMLQGTCQGAQGPEKVPGLRLRLQVLLTRLLQGACSRSRSPVSWHFMSCSLCMTFLVFAVREKSSRYGSFPKENPIVPHIIPINPLKVTPTLWKPPIKW